MKTKKQLQILIRCYCEIQRGGGHRAGTDFPRGQEDHSQYRMRRPRDGAVGYAEAQAILWPRSPNSFLPVGTAAG